MNEWPNFDEYTIAIIENEWEEDDVKEFTKLLEQSERA
jgi:molybdate-binding protein